MSVTLLIDVYSKQRSHECIHVDDRDSFLTASRAIDKALLNDSPLNVVLHNPAQVQWFDFYKGRIAFSSYDPCAEFAETLGINESQLPIEIVQDPKFIISAGLNERAKIFPPSSPSKLSSWILEHSLDPIWANERIDTYEQLASVLLYLVRRQNLKIHPTLQALRNTKIVQWKDTSGLKKVIKWLFADDPTRKAESLFFARLIWNYPHEVKLKALQFGNRWQDISLLEDYQVVIPQLPLQDCRELSLPSEIRLVIDEYLTQTLSTNSLDSVISILSGITEEEISIKRYLEKYFDTIDETWSDTLLELNRLFSHNHKSKTFISYLQMLVPIRKPSSLSASMSWDEVSNWLENEYFPYYRWCTALGKVNCTEKSVASFEEWLVQNYYTLTKTKAYAPYAVQPLISSRVSNSPVMHVILDCLPWIYAQYLQEKLRQRGIESIDTSMHLTTLPSITRVAKPSLIRGQLPGQLPAILDQSSKTYSDLFAQSIKLGTDEVLYNTSNETDIASMVTTRKKAYLYLDNDIDGMAHRQINSDRRRTIIESHLNEIVDSIITARESHKLFYGSELSVVISSDHGFTELPDDCTVLPVSEDEWSIDHNRLLLNNEKENPSPEDYFHISKDMLGGGTSSFYVARGYRAVGSRPKGAVHGGITPQEVIVPVLFIDSSVDMTFKSLSIAITGEVRRGRCNSISIEIFNSNSFPVTVKALDLRLVTVSELCNRRIMPGETAAVAASIDGSRIKEEVIAITGAISISFKGRDIMDNFEYQLSTIGAATADQAFEDEFDV